MCFNNPCIIEFDNPHIIVDAWKDVYSKRLEEKKKLFEERS